VTDRRLHDSLWRGIGADVSDAVPGGWACGDLLVALAEDRSPNMTTR
jgi:catechol 2,3-dioxygenase-like lactoylglutathione lyase family enzyme